jgi:uncharacterized protein YndB with AHSA1/START domain
MDLQTTVEIQAQPAEVWHVLTDVERWHEWTASIDSIRLLNGSELAVGIRASIRQPRMPAVTWTVNEVTPNRSFTWSAESMGTETVATHSIEPVQGGTRVTLTIRQSGALFHFMPWIKAMSQRYMEMEAQGLKTRSEALTLV